MAKQKADKVTGNLLAKANNIEKQARYKAKQIAKGLTQITVWVSPEQKEFVKTYLKGE